MRIVLSLLFLGAIIWFLVLQREELRSVFIAVAAGHWYWLSAVLILEILYFFIASYYYANTLELVGVAIRPQQVAPILLGAQIMGILVPSEFIATQTLFLRSTKQYRHSSAQVLTGIFLGISTAIAVWQPRSVNTALRLF